MTRIDRRKLLKYSGAATIATGTGGITAILASRRPAYAQATSIHWLRWSDFVPASDQLLKSNIVPQCEKALGIKLNLEMINANDIQAPAIQSGSGPDIFYVIGNWPQLYVESLSDVSDIAAEIGQVQGGYYDISKAVATVGQKWIGVPWTTGGGLLTYRKSANPGSRKSGIATANSRRLGTNTARPAKSSRPRADRLARRLATLSATPRASGIPISGRGAARRSRPTAKRWRSTARRRSSRSSLQSASGRTRMTKAGSPGTIRATIEPTWRAPSVAQTMAPRSISRPRRNLMRT